MSPSLGADRECLFAIKHETQCGGIPQPLLGHETRFKGCSKFMNYGRVTYGERQNVRILEES